MIVPPQTTHTQTCSRCKKHAVVLPVADPALKTGDAFREFLRKSYFHFLCNDCLSELESLFASANNGGPVSNFANLIEGTHYYMDDGLYVFTEIYHIAKGYCCGNHCRHCPYGIAQKT